MHPIAHAKNRGDHPAVIMANSGISRSYGELDIRANQFAHLLRSYGLKKGQAFAVLLENRLEYFDLVWGSQRAGTLLVPVPTRLTAPEICYMLGDSDAKLVVTSLQFAAHLADFRKERPDMRILVIGSGDESDFDAAMAAMPAEMIADPFPGQTMLYSSGTTGRPKGIMPKPPVDEDVAAYPPLMMIGTHFAGMPSDGSIVYLSPAPLYHAAPLGWSSIVQRLGGTVVVMEKFDAEGTLRAIERYRVTDSQFVPTHYIRMLRLPSEVRTKYDLSSHKRSIHAAAPCPVPVKEAMIAWWGPILLEYYAGSEGTGMTMLNSQQWMAHKGSVGPAIFGKIHICGPDGEELSTGSDGVIYFENEILPTYHNDAEKTASAMHKKGWMTLGDIGHLDEDGYLYLTDRLSHMIISGGVNIYPQEIENLLVSHEKVMDAAVIGAPDPDMGEKVVAVVQPVSADYGDLETELRDYLEGQLSHVKMPRMFVFRAELPREANGKLYKQELRREFAQAAQIEA